MKKQFKNIIFIPGLVFLVIAVVSCEKVIEVDLNEENSKIIVEGGISNQHTADTIRLSRTGSYFGDNNFQSITGAEVSVSDNMGKNELLLEVSSGTYVTSEIKGIPGNSYQLTVKSDGETISAGSQMTEPVQIQYLSYREKERTLGTRQGNYVTFFFKDPSNERNFYLVKASGTSVEYNHGSDNFFVVNDDFFDGNNFGIEIPFCHFNSGIATVELISIDKNAFDYYKSLNEVINNPGPGAFSGVPQYPTTSNLTGEALGYFRTFSSSVKSIRIY
ncbi:MAG: DUF4249 domain-containing protein [Bacteroidetes bacterium]|nr:DUF4249 domain-containing protein [Bacteroidota bacterium]HET6244545.1 DUF4249 domain-containing protein [Bacteroidia bacterium]